MNSTSCCDYSQKKYEIDIVIHNEMEKINKSRPLSLDIPLYYILPVSVNTDELMSNDIDLEHSNFIILSKKNKTGEKKIKIKTNTTTHTKMKIKSAEDKNDLLLCDMV